MGGESYKHSEFSADPDVKTKYYLKILEDKSEAIFF